MEPLNDDELNQLLSRWQAPPAPAGMDRRILGRETRLAWLRWLVNGSVRVPVPVGILGLAILLLSMYWGVSAKRAADQAPHTVTLTDFQPVKQLQPRIIRSGYEGQ